MRTRRATIAALGMCLVLFASGCRVSGLAFRQDERLEIISPDDRETVSLPFDVRWTTKDFLVVGADDSDRRDAGHFAVLLDVSPMPPGADLGYFARDDRSCRPAQGCPDEAYLADRNVFVTRDTTFTVKTLADTRPADRPSAADDHEITIVLLNGRSERIGESAFRVDVIVDRERS